VALLEDDPLELSVGEWIEGSWHRAAWLPGCVVLCLPGDEPLHLRWRLGAHVLCTSLQIMRLWPCTAPCSLAPHAPCFCTPLSPRRVSCLEAHERQGSAPCPLWCAVDRGAHQPPCALACQSKAV
jgi:hypothetical protein